MYRSAEHTESPTTMSASALLLLLLPLVLTMATATAETTTVASVTAASAPVTAKNNGGGGGGPDAPSPVPWPEQYHAVVITNLSASARRGGLQLIDLYYDWPRGRDLNIVRDQLTGEPGWTWNVEWTNGTAFLWDAASCATFQFAVGLLQPDWKSRGAAYLGRDRVDGFDCHVWSNFVFDRYYEDVATGRPVSWTYNGMQRHVLSFEAGAVMQDSSKWQAPAYCFTSANGGSSASAAASSS